LDGLLIPDGAKTTIASWPDRAAVARLVADIAAEEVMPRFRRLGKRDVREKRPGDLVTVVDEICERRLGEALTAMLPGSILVGEEGVAEDPELIHRIAGDAPTWIVDPLDGTTNYVRGRDRFAVIVAFAHRGRTLMGWIHDPIRRVTATTAAGQGAWLDGLRVSLQEPRDLGDLAAVLGIPSKRGWRREAGLRLAGATRTHGPIGSAGAAYLDLLTGRTHVALFASLKPWDHAAGVLALREAGGHAALADGRAYAPTLHRGALLAAPGRRLWESARAVLGSPPAFDAA
jgi:fructose-1,6-bisphosphatase/inositol monophosphatase family enzyme